MNSLRACISGAALLLFLFFAAGVKPSAAQQAQPTHIMHRLIPAGDTCATCHKAVYDQWKASPHSDNGVECTACHGETTSKNFASRPALSTCATCHTDQVAQLKSDPFMKDKACVSCHEAHVFAEHKKAGQ